MTREEWTRHKDFDTLSREMNGDFSTYRMNTLDAANNGVFLNPKKKNAAQVISDPPQAT